MSDISRQILPVSATLRGVLQRLNEGVSGSVFMVDESGRMVGMFTDGDARRAVLAAESLEEPAAGYMNTAFTVVPETMAHKERLKVLNERIRHLPVVDGQGRPVEMLSWAELWRLPLVEPSLGGNELKYVSECIKTNWISSQGAFVNRFEKEFAVYHGVKEAIAVSNGTTALHLALVAMGVGKGDEVIVPSLTFGATANAVIHAGAIPVFADVLENDWTIDAGDVRRKITEKTKAILPVHLYGVPAQMDILVAIAEEHGLIVLEDCAESLGARCKGSLTGTFGLASAFSFFANKTITTGEGGMILTSDETLADRIRLFRDHGMRKERRYWHEEAGYNYRITNMQSAVGCAQMERLDDFLEHRKKLGEIYQTRLGQLEEIRLQEIGADRTSSFWLYSVILTDACAYSRDELVQELLKEGIESRPVFYPLHIQPAYREYKGGECPVSDRISSRGISLPTSNHMGLEEAERVCRAVGKIFSRGRLPEA